MADPQVETARLTGDQYMDLLLERQRAYMVDNGIDPETPFKPLLESFVRAGDELLFTPPQHEPLPKRETTPRTYRSAASLREERDRLVALRAPLVEPLSPDRAASGGVALGRRRTSRLQQREDGRLRRYVALTKRIDGLGHRIALAEARERKSMS